MEFFREIFFAKFARKHLCWSLFLIKLQAGLYPQKEPLGGVLWKKCSENIQQIYRRIPMPKCDFNKIPNQLFWNHTFPWMFSCKFAAYFRNTFPKNNSGGLLPYSATSLKERTPTQVFSDEFCEVLKITFLQNISRKKYFTKQK